MDEFKKICIDAIRRNKVEFDSYLPNQKLAFVKRLKELTGGGLKECKDISDLYFVGQLPLVNIREERQKKLERLAKRPLAESIALKIKDIDVDKLDSFLMELSIDELLSIDEIFPNEND